MCVMKPCVERLTELTPDDLFSAVCKAAFGDITLPGILNRALHGER